MRVISGNHKGRPLQAVPGKLTRPTTDKVKESMFNMLEQHEFNGGVGLDLYAGTGGLGIEALSRGYTKFIFVDVQRAAIKVIHENLASLSLKNRSEVYKNDAFRALKALTKRDISFDLIFLDPPYAKQDIPKQIAFIEDHHLLKPQGIVIAETDKTVQLPVQKGKLILWKQQHYGDTVIRLYREEGGA
ncbi:16S rRNA (guanine(966)-N(2))-methyltransferase RsmD [Caldalkalibacillus salinus]|uniref:16S rRNA (guanine(966)-N(2))-methyltransferase RsmD n=1 Tax=Caldalkalibacillus salinus TaxID=2803787 RepID=UPI00192429CF|nr:16S rRNA (guanine(966)-N(2))-methyltransferase RsmD [Caldalkalibacillus salinus]